MYVLKGYTTKSTIGYIKDDDIVPGVAVITNNIAYAKLFNSTDEADQYIKLRADGIRCDYPEFNHFFAVELVEGPITYLFDMYADNNS